uniref:Beta 1,2-xylosyltransferase n=1 Tax=Physcomitrium patens TaxID=3218 RepID=Q8L5D2_PHYPA|nr:beta 1,2-xylosyltransferase [Physcomitrium patens]
MALMQSHWGGRGVKLLWVKRVVILLVLLNVFQLLILLNSENRPVKPSTALKDTPSSRPQGFSGRQSLGKPWPLLGAFTSWTVDPDLDPDSCEAFFGNGYTQAFTLLDPGPHSHARGSVVKEDSRVRSKRMQEIVESWREREVKQGLGQVKDEIHGVSSRTDEQAAQMGKQNKVYQPSPRGGLFQCFYGQTLRTSICEGTNMIMYPKKIKMSKGGELLFAVMGRNEEEELPYFTTGAFEIMVPEKEERRALFNKSMLERLIPVKSITKHTMHHLFEQIRTIPVDEVICAQRVSTPTIVVTRFEYANLFLTVTDWYSAYITSRVTNLKRRPRLVFVDGHCKSPMDEAWQAMFSGVHFARHLTGPVCFDHLIFAPLGYNSPLFKGLDLGLSCTGCAPEDIPNNPRHNTARIREFGEFFVAAMNTTANVMPQKAIFTFKVLFVRREDYLAHPRHSGKPESRLSNEVEVLEAPQAWASSRSGMKREDGVELSVTIVEGLFAHWALHEQLKIVRESSIIIGAHGAGLSHLLFAMPRETVIVELSSPFLVRPHFEAMSQWMGMEYHKTDMAISEADCSEVIRDLDQIFLGLIRRRDYKLAIP